MLIKLLASSNQLPRPQLYAENDGWSLTLPGVPVAADSTVFDEAVATFVELLRDYSEDWVADEDLRRSLSHRDNAPLVWFVHLVSDDELREWVLADDAAPDQVEERQAVAAT